jgi:RNA polymerase sigma-70 factor, ECF subfamily
VNIPPQLDGMGLFDARYAAFLETVAQQRDRLHRYCARMTGSVLDGEDIMQEVLFEAYRKLESLDEPQALRPWLFSIAHNRCIDFLRKRDVRESAEANFAEPDLVPGIESAAPLHVAVERLVVNLPPMERACVLLKDVFENTLEEIAGLTGTTIGGVKAALNRGRSKLASLPEQPTVRPQRRRDPELLKLLQAYAERFNRCDWEGVRELAGADARLRVSDCFAGRLADSPYFIEYERGVIPWRMQVGEIDGEPVVIVLSPIAEQWMPRSVIRISVMDGSINSISDYFGCSWIVPSAREVAVSRDFAV